VSIISEVKCDKIWMNRVNSLFLFLKDEAEKRKRRRRSPQKLFDREAIR